MKFAIQDGLFSYENIDAFFGMARDWGFDAVEVMGQNLDNRIDRIKAASKSSGLPVCAICPGLDGIRASLFEEDEELRKGISQDIIKLLQLGAELGGAGLNIVPEFAKIKFMRLAPVYSNFEQRKDIYLERIAPFANEAEKLGVDILLEPLNRYEADFLLTVEQAAELCIKSANTHMKILADLFHMNIEDADAIGALSKNIEYIGHVHFADSNRHLPGLGHTDFAAAIATLDKAGYKGYASLECGILGAPAEEVPVSLAYLKKAAGL